MATAATTPERTRYISPTHKRTAVLMFLDQGVWSLPEIAQMLTDSIGYSDNVNAQRSTSATLKQLVDLGLAERLGKSRNWKVTWAITEEGAAEAARIRAIWRRLSGDDDDDGAEG